MPEIFENTTFKLNQERQVVENLRLLDLILQSMRLETKQSTSFFFLETIVRNIFGFSKVLKLVVNWNSKNGCLQIHRRDLEKEAK
jgi:hypothetical protein